MTFLQILCITYFLMVIWNVFRLRNSHKHSDVQNIIGALPTGLGYLALFTALLIVSFSWPAIAVYGMFFNKEAN